MLIQRCGDNCLWKEITLQEVWACLPKQSVLVWTPYIHYMFNCLHFETDDGDTSIAILPLHYRCQTQVAAGFYNTLRFTMAYAFDVSVLTLLSSHCSFFSSPPFFGWREELASFVVGKSCLFCLDFVSWVPFVCLLGIVHMAIFVNIEFI